MDCKSKACNYCIRLLNSSFYVSSRTIIYYIMYIHDIAYPLILDDEYIFTFFNQQIETHSR